MEQDEKTESSPLTGRAKVRALLIEPLEADGLQRPRGKGHDVESHKAFLDRLQDRLAYLDAETLVVLRHVVLRLAEGALQNQWPSLATVLNNAHRLASPPDAPIVTSWLASVEGPRAEAGGFLVELHAFLARHGRPPQPRDMERIRDEARENSMRAARLQRRIADGVGLLGDDAGWLDWYERQQDICRAVVRAGKVKRDLKLQGDAA